MSNQTKAATPTGISGARTKNARVQRWGEHDIKGSAVSFYKKLGDRIKSIPSELRDSAKLEIAVDRFGDIELGLSYEKPLTRTEHERAKLVDRAVEAATILRLLEDELTKLKEKGK